MLPALLLGFFVWSSHISAAAQHPESKVMDKIILNDNGVQFDATFLKATKQNSIIIFAVGSGGNPDRHLGLLDSLHKRGSTIIAPHFERLASTRPTAAELSLRARRLQLAIDFASNPNLPAIGMGHSIGATLLLALAGAQIWMGPEQRLSLPLDGRLSRLVLMTPPTGFLNALGALDQIKTPMLIWAGTEDVITPPAQAEFLRQTLEHQIPIDLRVVDGAGHFSFMNSLPPGMIDPMPDRSTFLEELSDAIWQWISKVDHHG